MVRAAALLVFVCLTAACSTSRQVAASADVSARQPRNHGAAFGRVLVGMTLPATTTPADLAAFAERLGYPFSEETDSEVYARFLR